ncbi:hypothetical protein ACFL2V_07100 [Pseudomonadota bacterium]
MNVGILGLGEVGSAIKKLVSQKHKSYVREINFDEIASNKINVLHICIPFTPKFISIVEQLITETKPKLTIINSTVKPGTTNKLHNQTKTPLVHAPIQGVHPNLYKYFFQFPKFIGAVNHKSYKLAHEHFTNLGVKVERFDSPLESELAKLLSTTINRD